MSENELEQRMNIKFLVRLGKTGREIRQLLVDAYGDNAMKKTAVYKWAKHFTDEVSGNQRTSRTAENIAKVRQIVLEERRPSIGSIAERLNIDRETVRQILTLDLQGSRKTTIGGPSNGKSSKSAKAESKSPTVDMKEECLSPSYDDDIESKDNVGESTDNISESKILKVEVKDEPSSPSSAVEPQVTKKELADDGSSESMFPFHEFLHVEIKNEPQSPSYADK